MSLLDTNDRRAWRRAPISMLMATWFGVGHLPGGPGTYAAILVLPLIYWCSHALGVGWHVLGLAALIAASVWWSGVAADRLGEPDSRKIVIDEVVGVWLTLVWFGQVTSAELVIGCVAFRVADIAKPWPCRWLDERVHGGLGIVLDDLVAALYAIIPVVIWRVWMT